MEPGNDNQGADRRIELAGSETRRHRERIPNVLRQRDRRRTRHADDMKLPTKRVVAIRPLVEAAHSPDFSKVPIDAFPSVEPKRQYIAPCGHELEADPNYLLVANAQLAKTHAEQSIECANLQRALRRAESDVVIVSLAGIALLVITILGLTL